MKTITVTYVSACWLPADYFLDGKVNPAYFGKVWKLRADSTWEREQVSSGKTDPFTFTNIPEDADFGVENEDSECFGVGEKAAIIELPTHKEVCSDCGGEGFVLNESMRGHAYTMEEFREAFEDEIREMEYDDETGEPVKELEYFRRGGIYDVQCPTCHGKNVVDVIDEDTIDAGSCPFQKAGLEAYRARGKAEAEARAEARYCERMGF